MLRSVDGHVADYFVVVDFLGEDLGVSGEVVGFAKDVLRLGRVKRVTAGRSPRGLAAAALYIACVVFGCRVRQSVLAERAGVTEVTVRNNYRLLCRRLGFVVKVTNNDRFL